MNLRRGKRLPKNAKIEPKVWYLRLLGDLSLQWNGREIRRFRAQKYAHLLAYLALNQNRAHAREELVEIFWPEEPLPKARTCLRTALSSLRRQLDCPELFLDGARDSVRINPNALTTDVQQFELACSRRDPKAISLYGGPLLAGCYDDWALDERLRLDGLFEQASSDSREPSEVIGEGTKPQGNEWQSKLPSPISHFFGRKEEIDQIGNLLKEARLVTLVGMGGIGKTRLAIEAARSFSDRKILFVPLAEQTHLGGVQLQVADAIEISRSPNETLEARLVEELGKEPTLLVLDNFEQLVELESCDWLTELLSELPLVSVLVTSRLVLGIEGEVIYHVRPLSQAAAMELFMDRARHVLPDFPESPELGKLCDSLDRLPLAIVLCASWANVLSTSRMISGLSDRFELMQSRKRMVADRHKSLQAVIEWSCPVDSELQSSLGRLSVLRSSWSLEAAEAILGNHAARMISFLSERSLIQSDVSTGEVRFQLLESVRDFGLSTLSPDELTEAKKKHFDYYSKLGWFESERHAKEPHAAFEVLAREHANIYAALDFGLCEDDALLERALRTIYRIRWCWWVRGYGTDLVALFRKASGFLTDDKKGALRGLLLSATANVEDKAGNLLQAIEYSRQASQAYASVNEVPLLIENLRATSHYLENSGDFAGAIQEIEASLKLIPESDRAGYFINLAHLAGLYMDRLQDVERAKQLYIQMNEFWTRQPNAAGHIAVITRSLGRCAMYQENYKEAEDLIKQSIEVLKTLGETARESETWQALGDCYQMQGDLANAEKSFDISKRLSMGLA